MNNKKLQNLEIDLKGKTSGETKCICPKCSHKRKNKKDKCLSVNIDTGLYNCHNCGWGGNVNFIKKKEYTVPVKVHANVTDRVIGWFKSRKITEPTLVHWKIGESMEYMPQVENKRRCINFNYHREGKVVNVKYRDAEKHFKMVQGAELIFYGLDNIKNNEHCYIVEGEMDALSLHESGLYSVCSVPNGASKGNNKLDYLDNCYEYFKNKKEIILCTDNDDAGLQLRNELARRLGSYRCKYVEFGDFKDANDVLVSKGSETLRNIIKSAKNFPLDGVLNIDNIWNDVLLYNEKGFETYSIGLGDSDNFFTISWGQWTVVTGIPNSGKSDVCDQIFCNLATKYGFRTAMFSPESYPYEGHIKRIANKLNSKICDNNDLENTKSFITEHFHWIKIDLENLTLKNILNKFRELVFQKGVRIFCIDPFNMLDHSAQRDYSYIGKILSEITQFVQQTNTHLFLVAHPRKIESENGVYQKVNLYSISGSADFFNKAYNGIVIQRMIGQKTKYKSDLVKIYIEKVKRKENGQIGDFDIAPDFEHGGVYKSLQFADKTFEVIKDSTPF